MVVRRGGRVRPLLFFHPVHPKKWGAGGEVCVCGGFFFFSSCMRARGRELTGLTGGWCVGWAYVQTNKWRRGPACPPFCLKRERGVGRKNATAHLGAVFRREDPAPTHTPHSRVHPCPPTTEPSPCCRRPRRRRRAGLGGARVRLERWERERTTGTEGAGGAPQLPPARPRPAPPPTPRLTRPGLWQDPVRAHGWVAPDASMVSGRR